MFEKVHKKNTLERAIPMIQRCWRAKLKRMREQEYRKWLPLDIDPDNCNFDDVNRVLKVLDDYAIKKRSELEDEPELPNIIKIQRAIRSYLVRTRLQRCIRDGLKVVRAFKAMARFEARAEKANFFYEYEMRFQVDIQESTRKRKKAAERQARIDAGEVVSDSSSVKERKRLKKKAYLAKIRRQNQSFSKPVKSPPKPISKTQSMYGAGVPSGFGGLSPNKIEAHHLKKQSSDVHPPLMSLAKITENQANKKATAASGARRESKPTVFSD